MFLKINRSHFPTANHHGTTQYLSRFPEKWYMYVEKIKSTLDSPLHIRAIASSREHFDFSQENLNVRALPWTVSNTSSP